MIPKCRIYCYETQEMIVARDYRELAELFAGLDADDSIFSEPMQSTGLLDKNGDDIFEGDVVSFSIDNGWDYVVSENGLIIYSDGCYQILENGIKYRINQCLEEDIEVIGDIYQNKELVEGQVEK